MKTMKAKGLVMAVLLILSAVGLCSCTSKQVPGDTLEKIRAFIKTVVADSLEKDYQSHGIMIRAAVTNVAIDKISQDETAQDRVYSVWGRVSYKIEGKRTWTDKEGNIIRLDPEQEVMHWFTCGVLQDKYLGRLFPDDRNLLTFYADNPLRR